MNSFLTSFNSWYNEYHQELNNNLAQLKSIADIEEKYKKAEKFFFKHSQVEDNLRANYNNGKLQDKEHCSWKYHDYNEKVHQLKKIRDESKKKIQKNSNSEERENPTCYYCQNTPTNPYIWNNKKFCNQYCLDQWQLPCDECGNYRQGNNWQRTDKNDNKKFCSQECFYNHYPEVCDKCRQKTLGQTYYNDIKNKLGTLCSTCHQKRKEEERREEKTFLQSVKKEILDAYNTLQSEAEQKPSVPFFKIFDLSLVMESKSYQANKDMEVNCKAFLCDQLKEKWLSGELESYVEQVKKKISEVRQSSPSDSNSEERIEETISPIVVNSKDNSKGEENSNLDDKSNQIKSNQIKSNQIKSNQIKSNQIKSNQIKSNQIKSSNFPI